MMSQLYAAMTIKHEDRIRLIGPLAFFSITYVVLAENRAKSSPRFFNACESAEERTSPTSGSEADRHTTRDSFIRNTARRLAAAPWPSLSTQRSRTLFRHFSAADRLRLEGLSPLNE